MNDILIDSSAWIEYFRAHKGFRFIDELIDNNTLCTNDLILTELLPSIKQKKENGLADLLNSLINYEIAIDWNELRDYQLLNLKHGNNNIGIADLIIVQNCIQNGLKLVTWGKHFLLMAKYLPLEIQQWS
jgi:predicted nucleic acid-binding protein